MPIAWDNEPQKVQWDDDAKVQWDNDGPIHDIAENIGKPAIGILKATGNTLLDGISYLNRPAQALMVGARDAYRTLSQDPQALLDAARNNSLPTLLSESGAAGDFASGAKKGFLGQDATSTQQAIPEDIRKENPGLSGIAGFAGDVAVDPLTYTSFGVVPAVKHIGKALSKIDMPNTAFGKALNVNFGDLRTAKQIEGKYRDLVKGQTDDVLRQSKEYQARLESVSKETGIPLDELKARIVNEAEVRRGEIDPIADEAVELIGKNAEQIQAEKNAGIKIDERDGYFPHVLTKEGRSAVSKENFKDFFRKNNRQHASTKQRKLEGTVAEINSQRIYGTKKFFYDDPVIAQAVRDVRHAQAIGSTKFIDDVSESLGKTDDAPAHFVESKAKPGIKFDPDVAKLIDSTHAKISDPEELSKFLKVYDGAQNWWKQWSLGARPAYHARNVIGNMWNNYLADVGPLSYKDASRVQSLAARNKLNGMVAGKPMAELVKEARERGVLSSGQYSTDIVEETTKVVERESAKFKPSKLITPSTNNAILRAGFKGGQVLENNARLAHFIDRIKKGDSYEDAAASTKKYLFDYGDLSDVEREVFKRVAPFYTWSRKNIPLQVEALLTKPGKINKVNIAKNQFHQQEEPPDEDSVPDYLKDAGPIYVGSEGETKTAKTLAGYLPLMDVNKVLNPVDLGVGMVSPLLKEPVEQAYNYDSFYRKNIDRYEALAKLGVNARESKDWLGVKMPSRLAKLSRNLIMLNELDRLNPGDVFGNKAGKRSFGLDREYKIGPFAIGTTRESRNDLEEAMRWTQYAVGVRPYKVDEEAGKLRNLYAAKRELIQLKSYFKQAARKGNTREQQEAMAALQEAIDKIEARE